MRNAYRGISVIVVIGVIVVGWIAFTFTDKPGADEASIPSEEFVMWKMGSGDLLLNAPEAWEVRQYDAGGGSVVTVRSDASEFGLDIIVTIGEEFFSSEPIDFENWLRTETAGKSACESRTIGGIAMRCFSNTDGTISYYGQREDDRFAALFFTVIDKSGESLRYDEVLNSLDFMPSEAFLAEARIIP